MKRKYSAPNMVIFKIQTAKLVMNSVDGETYTIPIYTDDPQVPGNSLSRQHSVWNEEEEEYDL